jgi:hypothetical protein
MNYKKKVAILYLEVMIYPFEVKSKKKSKLAEKVIWYTV